MISQPRPSCYKSLTDLGWRMENLYVPPLIVIVSQPLADRLPKPIFSPNYYKFVHHQFRNWPDMAHSSDAARNG